MRKFISVLSLICILCTFIVVPAKAETLQTSTIEKRATEIYQQMLIDSGLAEQSSNIILKCNSLNTLDVKTYSIDTSNQTVTNTISYIDENGELVDAYSAIYRSVATGKTAELSNTKIMGFNITVNYNYYYREDNDYVEPHYRHGSVEVTASTNPMISSIGNFNCVYVSRGVETNAEGDWSGDFITCVSRIEYSSLGKGDYHFVRSGDCGNPYLWKFSSTPEGGTSFSGIAYSFTFGGRTYSDTSVILYDTTQECVDFDDFDWGI